jgi:hypothetical protein
MMLIPSLSYPSLVSQYFYLVNLSLLKAQSILIIAMLIIHMFSLIDRHQHNSEITSIINAAFPFQVYPPSWIV